MVCTGCRMMHSPTAGARPTGAGARPAPTGWILFHPNLLDESNTMPDLAGSEVFQAEAERFKLLGHLVRLQILDILRRNPECVCHLEVALGKPQPYISPAVACAARGRRHRRQQGRAQRLLSSDRCASRFVAHHHPWTGFIGHSAGAPGSARLRLSEMQCARPARDQVRRDVIGLCGRLLTGPSD